MPNAARECNSRTRSESGQIAPFSYQMDANRPDWSPGAQLFCPGRREAPGTRTFPASACHGAIRANSRVNPASSRSVGRGPLPRPAMSPPIMQCRGRRNPPDIPGNGTVAGRLKFAAKPPFSCTEALTPSLLAVLEEAPFPRPHSIRRGHRDDS
jgi:hypothetical protein